MSQTHRVVIVGAGFGGLYAAKKLGKAPVAVTVIDRRNFHLFQPLLYQVATGALSPGEVASPIRVVLQKNRNTPVKDIHFDWTLDELHATSWNTASATGAIAHMDYSQVKRYTRIYDLQQQFMTTQNRAFDAIMGSTVSRLC